MVVDYSIAAAEDFSLSTAKRRVAFSSAQRRRRLSHAYEPQVSPKASPVRRSFGSKMAKKARLQNTSQHSASNRAFELFAFDASSP